MTGTVRSRPEFDEAAGPGWQDRVMTEDITDRLHEKQGRSIARWTLERGKRRMVVYLKRHFRFPRRLALLAKLLPGRAWTPALQEWENLRKASELGIPIPTPMAAGEMIGSGGELQSFFAVEELTDMLPLHEAVPMASRQLSHAAFAQWKRSLASEMARLTKLLHGNGYFHKDLYFCHFYVDEKLTSEPPKSWHGRVFLIDFHRFARHRLGSWWWRVKDLAQLLYSSEVEGVTDRDRVRFWKLLGTGDGLWSRFTRWAVLKKWRLYRRHNRKGK